MIDFLKALVEKLRVDLLLASLAIAILFFKLCEFDAWWMVFVLSVSYITTLGVENGFKAIMKKRESKKKAIDQAAKTRQEEEDLNEEIWKRFFALDSQSLWLLKAIFVAEKDPTNPLIRYVRDGGSLAYEIDKSYVFRIPEVDRVYYPLLYAEHLANSSVITFQSYYMKLVARYV